MLSDRLIKVDFSRGFPSLSKYDKEISLEIAEIKGADVNKIRLTKRLYDKQFTKFEKIAQDFQNYFYSITERWGKDFILPSFLFESFNERYQQAKEEFEKSKRDFIAGIESGLILDKSKNDLNLAFNSSDYRRLYNIEKKFYFDVEYSQFIADPKSIFLNINEVELEKIRLEESAKFEQRFNEVINSVWNKTAEAIKNLLEKLEMPEKNENGRKNSYKESTLKKVQNLTSYIEGFNLNDDSRLKEISEMIKGISEYSKEDLEKFPEIRNEVKEKTSEIMKKINSYI